jgi:hypothetical protein
MTTPLEAVLHLETQRTARKGHLHASVTELAVGNFDSDMIVGPFRSGSRSQI